MKKLTLKNKKGNATKNAVERRRHKTLIVYAIDYKYTIQTIPSYLMLIMFFRRILKGPAKFFKSGAPNRPNENIVQNHLNN